jgi:phage FluMu protein Com
MRGFRKEETFIRLYGEVGGRERYRENKLKRESTPKKFEKPEAWTEDHIESGDAIRCRSCGVIMQRMQWTHLKYKCNVSRTIDEYAAYYPDAPKIAPNLVSATAQTEENIKAKYGEELGARRWKRYCDLQAKTNSFEYKAEKYGMSAADFDAYNASRAVTLKNLTAKHGDIEGLIIWENYRERQRYTTSVEYFVEKYGEIEGKDRYESFCRGRNMSEKKISNVEVEFVNALRVALSDETFGPQINIGSAYYAAFDCGSIERKKIIEFYGSYWHADPRLYAADTYHIQKQQTAKMIWSRDRAKKTFAMNLGYSLYICWELDYYENKDKMIQDIKRWWNE